MPKRSLPTLPKTPLPTEQVGELTLYLGGKHGYKKVKLLEGGYQGYNNKRRLYTGTFHNARLAAIAIAQKEMDAECGTENVKSKKIIRTPCPKTIPLHLAHTYSIARVAVAQATRTEPMIFVSDENDGAKPIDPRDVTMLDSPKPLSPPGTIPDGFGGRRPLIAPIVRLTPAQAAGLLAAGVPLAMAHVHP